MISTVCFTNIDSYLHEQWPTEMVAVPNLGDWVESESGKILKVVKITHTQYHRGISAPYIRIELHYCG